MRQFVILLFAILLFNFPRFLNAQEQDTALVLIETIDGNEFVGKIIAEDSLKLNLLTKDFGELTILKPKIKNREEIISAKMVDGKYWLNNPQASRYFWSPNGYALKAHEGYYQNIWVFWNQFAYGITDNFSVGGGIIPVFLLGGEATPVFGTLKLSIPVKKDKINLGGGIIAGTVIGESESSLGLLYGLSTFGSRDNNMSIGVGYGFASGEISSTPLINISGMIRINNNGYLLTENYIVINDGEGAGMIMVGGRWIIKKAALDFGLVIPAISGMDTFIGIPWLGFTIPFGNTQ